MSCIFRISGELLDIDSLLEQCSVPVYRRWRKGEPRAPKGKFHSDSGANFIASDADFIEFDNQVFDATAFLEVHASAIAEIIAFPGLQNASLDLAAATKEVMLRKAHTCHQSSFNLPRGWKSVLRFPITLALVNGSEAEVGQ